MKHPDCRVLFYMGGEEHEVKITGLGELEKKLKRLSDVARTDAKQEALYTSSVLVQGDATLNAPVGQYNDGRVGGNLRSSIDYEVGTDNADIFATANYAEHVEYGTKNMKSQPFLRPSLDNNKSSIIKIFSDTYAKYLKR